VRGIVNVLKYLRMLEGEPELPKRQLVYHTAPHVRPTKAGYLVVEFDREEMFEGDEVGIRVSEGDLLARVFDPYTFEQLEEIRAPVDGLVYFMRTSGLVHAGSRGFSIAPFSTGEWIS
jgi:predicted deacylase